MGKVSIPKKPASSKRRDILPNAITLARGACVVPIVILLLGTPIQAFCGWALFAVACTSDFFDGYLARRWDVVSDFGTALDPILDKLLVFAVFLPVLARGGVDEGILPQAQVPSATMGMSGLAFGCASAILLREIIVSGLREFLAQQHRVSLPVIAYAKTKTVAQMLGIGGQSLSIAALEGRRMLWFSYLADLVLLFATILTFYTGYFYVRSAAKQMARRRAKP